MRRRNKPTITLTPRAKRSNKGIVIIPFFIDNVKPKGDLFRFVCPMSMTFCSISISIDKMVGGPYILNGGIRTKSAKISRSQPVRLGVNDFPLDFPVQQGDILILDFEDKDSVCPNVSGITISITAER